MRFQVRAVLGDKPALELVEVDTQDVPGLGGVRVIAILGRVFETGR